MINISRDVLYSYSIATYSRNTFLEFLAFLISLFGDGIILIPLFAVIYYFTRNYKYFLLLATAITAGAATFILKNLIMRPRPLFFEESINGYSFPSGHTTTSFAVAVVLSDQYPKYSWLFYIFAGIIGFSRIMLGVHYITDVLFGFSVGVAIGLLVLKHREKLEFLQKRLENFL